MSNSKNLRSNQQLFLGMALVGFSIALGIFLVKKIGNNQRPLIFKEPNIFLGNIEQGKIIKCQFKIANQLNTHILINNIISNCNCTTVPVSEKKLLPQEVWTMEVELNTRGKRGYFEEKILVEYAYEANKTKIKEYAPLKIMAFCNPILKLSANSVTFSNQHEKNQAVTILPRQDVDFKVIKAYSNSAFFLVKLLEKDLSISIELRANCEDVVDKDCLLIIETTLDQDPVIKIPIKIQNHNNLKNLSFNWLTAKEEYRHGNN